MDNLLTDIVDEKHDFDDLIEDITRKLSDFNLQNDFPTGHGHFRGDITDRAIIIDCGGCRSKDSKYFVTTDGTKNFSC